MQGVSGFKLYCCFHLNVWPSELDRPGAKEGRLLVAYSLFLSAVSYNYVWKFNCCVPDS
jgi:hypothetical protein